ncbi:unnamed protein product [Rotaria sordida]|uniref:Bulb-type lectin domain-containing protein n=1 Tax=Rotaria sordida TaxID=392033 RepID=A0A815AIY5_9BILA|nr:unnamed protein product [Rotaria sordida]
MSILHRIYDLEQQINNTNELNFDYDVLSLSKQQSVAQNPSPKTSTPIKRCWDETTTAKLITNQRQEIIPTSTNHVTASELTTKASTGSGTKIFAIGLILGILVSRSAMTGVVVVWQNSAPPSTLCVNSTSDRKLYNNEFIYSPTSQVYAAGMLNNQFGIYMAYGYGNVTSTTIRTASQSTTSITCHLQLQTDRNVVVYTTTSSIAVWAAGVNNGGSGKPFCLQMLDSGNLIWNDNAGSTIWQTNSAQSG